MSDKSVRIRHVAVLTVLAATGCSLAQGSPDGWRYLRTDEVSVAHPESWRQTATGAVLQDGRGRTDAGLAVLQVPGGVPGFPVGNVPGGTPGAPPGAHRRTVILDGHRAEVLTYGRPAPDGRHAVYVDVGVRGRGGRPLLVRAWTADGDGRDPELLREVVNSIEFLPGKLP